jgi:AcrR family transcriptional regulator
MRNNKNSRDLILQSAFDLFIEQGYHATTTRQVTERIHLAAGSLYNHFKGKEAIFQAVLQKYHPWLYIPQAVREAKGKSIDEFVYDSTRLVNTHWQKNPTSIKLHMIELVEFQGKHLADLFELVFSATRDAIREQQKNNPEIADIPTATLGRSLLGLFFATMMMPQFTGLQDTLKLADPEFGYFADAYLHGIIGRPIHRPQSRKFSSKKKH